MKPLPERCVISCRGYLIESILRADVKASQAVPVESSMLEVHHLGRSQSERVVWLCEELGIDYKLHIHERNPDTALTPPALAEVHPAGTAPVIVDTTPGGKRVVIGESGACLEYIANVYGNGRFQVKPGAENYGGALADSFSHAQIHLP